MSASSSATGDSSIWDLWSECAKEAETLGDPLFLECLEAASARRIFDDLSDDKLKVSFSLINSLLNDPKTRAKGLTLLNDLSSQINPSRLITYQDAIASALHLVIKGLDSPLACTVLTNLLPKCHSMSEVNQLVTSTIIPKILANFCENGGGGKESTVQKSVEELQLLKTCLVEYHGPCGQFRDKLERVLVHLTDSETSDVVEFLSEVMPLLSYSGGGGNAGEKHANDWSTMLTKFLKTTYTTLYQLYGSDCATLEPDNPFDGDFLPGHKKITETQILLRMSLLKRRLLNLLTVTSGYFRFPFPAPKLVPLKGTLKLIEFLALVNPVAFDKSHSKTLRKETMFLSAIVPGIHSSTLTLLRSLICCVGSNILTEGVAVEQLLAGEFKWIQERPSAYGKLKLDLYETLITWLAITGGIVTNLKTLGMWVNAIGNDTRMEKDVVELKMLSKLKSGKSVKSKSSSLSLSINPASISTTTSQTYVRKNSEVCQIALKTLSYLIPSLDAESHRKVYEHLIKTASILTQFHEAPSPYDSAQSRLLIFETITRLAYHPHPRSPLCLALLISLLRQGVQDPTRLVSSFCSSQICNLERLMHPTSVPLTLSGPASAPVELDNSRYNTFVSEVEVDEPPRDRESITIDDMDVSDADQEDQHEDIAVVTTAASKSSSAGGLPVNLDALESIIKKSIENVLRNQPSTANNNSVPIPVKPNRLVRSDQDLTAVTLDDSADSISENEDSDDIQILNDTEPNCSQNGKDELSPRHLNFNRRSYLDLGKNGEQEQGDLDKGDGKSTNIENNDVAGSKRKTSESFQSPNGSETIIGEIQVKKAKTTNSFQSPVKDATGPSVQEMLETFVDFEPVN